jgi:hypothetical protein
VSRNANALVALFVSVLALCGLAACAGVLGIDERKQDSATNYAAQGYEGCRPGGTCDACILPEHRSKCLAPSVPSVCDQGFLDDCGNCVCDSCRNHVDTCEGASRCAAIWTCLADTRCELLESSDNSCYQEATCRGVIEDNGGLDAKPFNDAVAVRVCAIGASCLSCLSPAPEPAPGCSPDNGCQDCGGCFQQCICSGDSFSTCQAACGSEAPPAACSEEDECSGCTRCFDNCTCHGGSFVQCTNNCRDTCTLATSCNDCADCTSRCVCNGGTQAACEASCAPSDNTSCHDGSNGETAACGGCGSCLAQCTCAGTRFDNCIASCNAKRCDCADKAACSPYGACLCESSTEACGTDTFSCSDLQRSCDSCLCNNCGPLYAFCHDTPGCPLALACMRDADCEGAACVSACAPAAGGVNSKAFSAAEALWACSRGASCGNCSGGTASPCGLECPPYHTDGDPIIAPCCDTAGAQPVCGLQTKFLFPNGPNCMPRNQPLPPSVDSRISCSGAAAPTDPPYRGVCFEGCRRGDAGGPCGVWDNVTGLGCIDPALFNNPVAADCLILTQ